MIPQTLRTSGRAATPMTYVQAIARAYVHYGKDPSGALRQAQITPHELKSPHARVTAAQFEVLSGIAMQELDDEALGWFSRRLPWGSYGMLCRASLTAPNLGVAIKRWCRHHRLLTDDVILSLDVANGVATVSITEHRDLDHWREFCLVTLLRYLHGYACWAIDSRIPLYEAHFPFIPPAHADIYALIFCKTVHFNAPRASFSFDERYLALPIQRDERALRTMLKRALPLTVLQYRHDRLLSQRVRELLRTRMQEVPNAQAISALLNVSSRTLHRQLHEEGASLQSIKDDVRRAQAIAQLRRSERPIKQIAMAIGFRNEKSFTRAFRQWTGRTPGEFRRAAPTEPE